MGGIFKKKTKKMKFRLSISKWIKGRLESIENYFSSLNDAKKDSKNYDGHIKIYDTDEETIVHSENKKVNIEETYN